MKKLPLLLTLMLLLLLAACGSTESTATATAEPVAATAVPADSGDESDDAQAKTDGLDISLFFDGALAEEATIQDCTLSDGTETTCYAITIAGYPADYDVGPFCPPTIESSAEEGGIWLDGTNVYDIDGEFILSLADIYNDDNWKLYDDDGNVNITDTAEEFEAAARPDVDPALQNHCVEGRIEWLDNGEPVPTTVLIPTTPVMADSASSGGNWGVTLNGVIIAAQAPVQAILSAYTIAAFDDCGGHINPVDGYHLHGARGCSEVGDAAEGETPIFAYALDGYPIHSPLDAEVEAATELDACNGHTTEAFGYHYHANPAEENGVLSCFVGLTTQAQGGDGGGQGGPPAGGDRPEGNQPGGAPDFAAAAGILGITEQELMNALGQPPLDLAATAAALNISEEALQAALDGETTGEAMDEATLFAIPGEVVFPEGVSYDPATGNFYVGSTTDGTLYVGNINGANEMVVFSEGGADGRTAAIGTKVDDDGLLWVAGGGTGQVFVYDTADGSHVATFTTPAADATFINDLAITESGVYFTDSFRPILWRASGVEGGEAEAWLDFTGSVLTYVDGFNLNGIVPTADGNDLIVVHSGQGALYRINIETQEVSAIDTGDAALTAGDGLALVGSTLYVTRNSFGEIVPVALSDDLSTGSAGTPITSDLFIYPTTIAYTGSSFLVANSQFNNRQSSPELPFTIAEIPFASGE